MTSRRRGTERGSIEGWTRRPMRASRRLRPGLVARSGSTRSGRTGPTRRSAAGGLWRRSSRGRLRPSSVEASLDQRIVEAAARLARARRRHRLGSARLATTSVVRRPRAPVAPAATGVARDRRRRHQGCSLASRSRRNGSIRGTSSGSTACGSPRRCGRHGSRCGTPRTGGWQWWRSTWRRTTTSCHSMRWRSGSTSTPGWTGAPQCRWALGYASENSWSPRETLTHLVWQIDADLPRLLCNCLSSTGPVTASARPIFSMSRRASWCSTTGVDPPGRLGARARDVQVRGEVPSARARVHQGRRRRLRRPGAHGGPIPRVAPASAFAAESARSVDDRAPRGWTPTHSVALRRGLWMSSQRRPFAALSGRLNPIVRYEPVARRSSRTTRVTSVGRALRADRGRRPCQRSRTIPAGRPNPYGSWKTNRQDEVDEGGGGTGHREGEDPGGDDAAGDAPADGGEALGGADAGHGRGDRVGGRDRGVRGRTRSCTGPTPPPTRRRSRGPGRGG